MRHASEMQATTTKKWAKKCRLKKTGEDLLLGSNWRQIINLDLIGTLYSGPI